MFNRFQVQTIMIMLRILLELKVTKYKRLSLYDSRTDSMCSMSRKDSMYSMSIYTAAFNFRINTGNLEYVTELFKLYQFTIKSENETGELTYSCSYFGLRDISRDITGILHLIVLK